MPRSFLKSAAHLAASGLVAAAALLPAEHASASSPYLVVPPASVAEATASYRYANMTEVEALAELDRRKVPYKKADPIDGVVTPVRLTGKLHGVYIHSSIPESQRATSVYEVLDARLALALDDFAKILERHDIEEVVHYSLYRPNVPREDHDVKEVGARSAAKSAEVKAAVATAAPAKAAIATAAPGKGAAAAPGKGAAAAPGKTAPAATRGAPVKVVAKSPAPGAAAPAKSVKKEPPPALAKKPIAALPALKGLPDLPAKGASSRGGSKQKTPAVASKSAAPAARAAKPQRTPTALKARPAARMRSVAPVASAPPAPVGQKAPARPAAVKSNAKAAPAAASARPAPLPASTKGTPVAAAKGVTGVAASVVRTAPPSRQTWAPPGTRHPAGLAIDVALLKKHDGQWISVAGHFQGKIGAKTCGDGVRTADTPEARELRSIVCEANDLGVFTYVLTPNFNAAHVDHFHMEIRPQVKWFLYQ